MEVVVLVPRLLFKFIGGRCTSSVNEITVHVESTTVLCALHNLSSSGSVSLSDYLYAHFFLNLLFTIDYDVNPI